MTSDGTTLLGADDKAGIAEIMAAVAHLARDGDQPRAPIRVAFTVDEEVGRGAEDFDLDAFGAEVAYTLDGSDLDRQYQANAERILLQSVAASTMSAHLAAAALGYQVWWVTAIGQESAQAAMRPLLGVPDDLAIIDIMLFGVPAKSPYKRWKKTLPEIIQETLLTTTSERQGRAIDKDAGGAGMEVKKQQGYF